MHQHKNDNRQQVAEVLSERQQKSMLEIDFRFHASFFSPLRSFALQDLSFTQKMLDNAKNMLQKFGANCDDS
jgi:hypothetical protein